MAFPLLADTKAIRRLVLQGEGAADAAVPAALVWIATVQRGGQVSSGRPRENTGHSDSPSATRCFALMPTSLFIPCTTLQFNILGEMWAEACRLHQMMRVRPSIVTSIHLLIQKKWGFIQTPDFYLALETNRERVAVVVFLLLWKKVLLAKTPSLCTLIRLFAGS